MTAINGETLIIEQADGASVELVVWGDEFYVRYETIDGYTVWPDAKTGQFCYADVRNGRFISTGASINKRPPMGLRRHLKESADIRQARFDARYNHIRSIPMVAESDGRVLTIGRNDGLLEGRRVSQGNVLGLTILVEFSDIKASVTREDVGALLNSADYTLNGNYCSVNKYFKIVSNNKLNYQNHVVGPVTLPNSKKYYETVSFINEAFQLAMDELDANGVDLSQFDSLNEGIFDAVNFMYAGRTVYGINNNNQNPSSLWPHNSITNQSHRGMRTHFYMLSSMGRRVVDLSIGTFCHESAHLLCRFPDLYDYGKRDGDTLESRGIGEYCLMGNGNHLNRGRTPSPICAYLRDLVDWVDEEISLDGGGSHSARHGAYGQVFKYLTDDSDEYFLIENRANIDLDEFLPSGGLAVYHCDRKGSNEYQAGTASRHYQVALLQADGRRDLEMNRSSDAEDLFGNVDGIALAHDTVPSATQWDGSDSGLIVANISSPGNEISFETGGDAIAQATRFSVEKIAHLLIPDDQPEGVNSVINVGQSGRLITLSIGIDVTHSYVGDLTISLRSPGGVIVVVHKVEGGSSDDLKITYTSDDSELSEFLGEDIAGDWSLHLIDHEAEDVGRLNSWKLDLEFEPKRQLVEGSVSPNLQIPDDAVAGVESTIAVQDRGLLKAVSVSVEISHSYIGDLYVELVSPQGQSVVLHNRTGRSDRDLRITYDATNARALDLLIDQQIEGDWKLRIRDLEAQDVGTLERWVLKLHHQT